MEKGKKMVRNGKENGKKRAGMGKRMGWLAPVVSASATQLQWQPEKQKTGLAGWKDGLKGRE
jgi:hypothetical protein